MTFSLPLCAAALLLLTQAASAVKPLGDYQSGLLTFYGGKPDGMDPSSPSYGSKEGACGFGTIPKGSFPYFSVAGISTSNKFFKAGPLNACGQCFQIECADKRSGACKTDSDGKPLSVLVMVTDKCPECEADHIDVQALSFAKIAEAGLGHVDMRYRRVECLVPGDMQVGVMDYGGAGQWIRLQVSDTGGRGAIQSVSVKGSNGDWQQMKNTWGAAWELGGAPAPPLNFRFTCDNGEVVEASNVVKQNGGISGGVASPVKFSTGEQFKITDPAAGQVQAFEGNSDPMLVTSKTPGNSDAAPAASASSSSSSSGASSKASSSSSSGSSSSGGAACSDVAPPGSYSCDQQKSFGKCSESFMVQGNYCAVTCGRCSSADSKQVKKFDGGRRLLAKQGRSMRH